MKCTIAICLLITGCVLDREVGHNENGTSGDPADRYSIVAEGPPFGMDLASDDESLFWVACNQEANRSTIHRVSKDGGEALELARLGKRVYRIRTDETHVYMAVYGVNPVGTGEISRVAKDGGPVEVLVPDLASPWAIAVDEAYTYYTHQGEQAQTISRVPKAGGEAEVILTEVANPWQLAVDESYLYYAEQNAGRVMRVEKDGGEPVELAGGFTATVQVAVEDGRVYFTACERSDCEPLDAYAVPKEGGDSTLLASLHGLEVGSLALAGGDLFFTGGMAGTVLAVPAGAGSPETLASDLPRPTGVTADQDGGRVFWVDFDSGEVGRVERVLDVDP